MTVGNLVEQVWRYPLKSAQGEQLSSVHVSLDGPEGDRAWACIAAEGLVVSAKNPRRWGRLLEVRAATHGSSVVVHIPERATATAGSAEADLALSDWLGQSVRLTNVVPESARLHRTWPTEGGMIPDWAGAPTPGTNAVTPIAGARPGGRFADFGALHILTSGALEALRAEGLDLDVRRFRPNLVLRLERDPAPGELLRIGDQLLLRCVSPTPRCAIPGAQQPGLSLAPEVLRAIGRNRVDVSGRGRAAVFGFYASVVAPGVVTIGDLVTVSAPTGTHEGPA